MNLPNFSLEYLVFDALFYLNNFCLGLMSITHVSDGPLQWSDYNCSTHSSSYLCCVIQLTTLRLSP